MKCSVSEESIQKYQSWKYYKNTFNDILALHMNPAEFQKWKDNNYVRWVEDKVYISRQLTDKFKNLN